MATFEGIAQAVGHGDLHALESFLVNNPDLEQLEALGSRFNIFEAMGVVGHELRRSDFLACLLDLRHSHGLNDLFAKRLLHCALQLAGLVRSA